MATPHRYNPPVEYWRHMKDPSKWLRRHKGQCVPMLGASIESLAPDPTDEPFKLVGPFGWTVLMDHGWYLEKRVKP